MISAVKIVIRASVRFLAVVLAYWVVAFPNLTLHSVADAIEVVWFYGVLFGVIGAVVDATMGLRRAHWKYISIRDLIAHVRTAVITILILLLAIFIIDRGWLLPRSAFVLAFVLDLGLVGGVLVSRRLIHEGGPDAFARTFIAGAGRTRGRTALMLVGSADAADTYLRGMSREDRQAYEPVGIISEDSRSAGLSVRGIRIVSGLETVGRELRIFLDRGGGKAVLLLDEQARTALARQSDLAGDLMGGGVALFRLPSLTDLTANADRELRPINFEDLLLRPSVKLDLEMIRSLIAGKRIMVTGAGGSIGSEICRQVTALDCSHISLLDNSEFLLFTIDAEIGVYRPTLSRREILCDVRDAARVRSWVLSEKPDIIFHAAALKHVPLVERHPAEGVLTNVMGTRNVAGAALEAGVEQMVFISTDKAVDPTNVMGATKRLAESEVRRHQERTQTVFSVVRFGNVLGSAGSVVPTFVRQIKSGGPVTVTHPDVERFFMTIPEAVQLVLHATAKSVELPAGQAHVLVLDMGKPVRIMDLAHQLIRLHGKEPDKDIRIEITGLRPGEKLSEELVDTTEISETTEDGLLRVIDRKKAAPLADKMMDRLEKAALVNDNETVRKLVFEMLAHVRNEAAG